MRHFEIIPSYFAHEKVHNEPTKKIRTNNYKRLFFIYFKTPRKHCIIALWIIFNILCLVNDFIFLIMFLSQKNNIENMVPNLVLYLHIRVLLICINLKTVTR